MSERTAVDTIKGYFYQFDYSIKKFLGLDNDETVTIEGVEDIDINDSSSINNAIQCKYYEKTEYNHSVIKKAIQQMLIHYSKLIDDESEKIKYFLYGHFKKGTDKLPNIIDINFLKKSFLTSRKDGELIIHHEVLGLDDKELQDFLELLEIDITAENFETQLSSVFNLIKEEFDCDDEDAENFYYNNALRVIKDLAVEEDISSRTLSRRQFIGKIDNKKHHFNKWFAAFKGKQNYHNFLRKKYFTGLNTSPFERFFLIDVDGDYKRSEIKDLIFTISDKYSQLSVRRNKPFCPYIYIHNFSDEELIKIKSELKSESFKFIDGFDFLGAEFDPASLTREANKHNQIRIKFINDMSKLVLVLNQISATKEIYQFFNKNEFYNATSEAIKQVNISIEHINDIKEII